MSRFSTSCAGLGVLLVVHIGCSQSSSNQNDDDAANPDKGDGPTDVVDAPDETYPGPIPPANLKIAFTGDTDSTSAGKKVMELVRDQGAHALVVAGDLNYQSGSRSAKWEDQIDAYLPESFPVFPVRGNHDESWSDDGAYHDRLTTRWDAIKAAGDLTWSGDPGMKSVTVFKGVTIVSVAPSNGVSHADSADFIKTTFATDTSLWRVAQWHENMPPFRVNAGCGNGGDLVGWEVFEEARKAGAFVVNGHNHAFGRTKLLSCTGGACATETRTACSPNNQLPTIANVPDPAGKLSLSAGETGTNFVMVVGLGGHETGRVSNNGAWWAKQGGSSCEAPDPAGPCEEAVAGAMFCTFNPGGTNPRKASCQYIDIDGKVIDAFEMTSELHRTPQQ
ncbi:MAG: metallophosphoesterase [Kofleriaceae bacterium]